MGSVRTTMQRAYVKAPFEVEGREVPIPTDKVGGALIKVKASGICGTEMHISRSQAAQQQGIGLEIAGI